MVRHPLLTLGVACLLQVPSAAATEFGGGIAGPEHLATEVLGSLQNRPGFRWIRSPSTQVPKFGFEGIGDVRLKVPGGDQIGAPLPDDLFTTFRACRDRLPAFPGAPDVWEVWNEPDFYFVTSSAADMAATLKAAWWGVKASRPNAQVLMPSLAFRPGRYALELAANGLASWTDGWNAHFYGWSADYPAFLAQHRAFAHAIGCSAPLWITEIGYLGMPQFAADDPAALAAQAAFHERTMIESWARGVDRHLLFLLTAYSESRNDLGLTSTDGTWRPAMDSAVRLARALAETRPLYRIRHRASGEDVGIVLQSDPERWWTVLWSPARPGESQRPGAGPRADVPEQLRIQPNWPASFTEIRTGIEADVALAPSQLREIQVAPSRNAHLHTPSGRFGLSGCRWIPWSNDVPEVRAERATRKALAAVPPRHDPSPVVVRVKSEAAFHADKPAQTLRLPEAASAGLRLEFYNFSDVPRSGAWTIEVPPGWQAKGEPVSRRLEVGPLSRSEVVLDLGRQPAAAGNEQEPGRFWARWKGDDGSVDAATVRLEPDPAPGRVWHRWSWRDLVAQPARTDAWQVFQQADGTMAVEVRVASGPNREIAVHLAVPRNASAADAFTFGIRHARGTGTPFVQTQMTTRSGEGWRHGELVGVTSELRRFEARLGDFGPAIWGRHETLLFPPVSDVRWLTLAFQGVQPGDVLEIGELTLRRP